MDTHKRCSWVGNEKIYQDYHDNEWGCELHDDQRLFEFLSLEGMQAGLSWLTVLKKRNNYRVAFDDFDVEKIKLYDDNKVNELLENKGIIRNRLKVLSIINNSKCFINIQNEFGSFDKYIWSFVDYKPIIGHYNSIMEIPTKTELSDKISKDLLKRGFKFVGSTIIYAFMQAIGMVNDHTIDCFIYQKLHNKG